MVTELASDAEGATVMAGTSFDSRHPIANVIEDDESVWITTGLYPHEFILRLGSVSQISRVATETHNAKKVVIERCERAKPVVWEPLAEIDLEDNDGELQIESAQVSRAQANFVKFRFVSGYDDFCAVRKISVQGRSLSD